MSDAGIAELTRGIEPYRRGNTGIDFVHLIESGRPGPHAMIMGLTHGNEPCGMWAVTRLLDLGFRPARGRLSLGLGNIAAYAYLQAGLESQTRFLHRDLNRLWRDGWIDGDGESLEARRARELRPHLQTVDVLLDLHSTASVPRPFFVLAELPKTRALADAMAWPATQQLMPGGCPEGRHLVDYGRCPTLPTPRARSPWSAAATHRSCESRGRMASGASLPLGARRAAGGAGRSAGHAGAVPCHRAYRADARRPARPSSSSASGFWGDSPLALSEPSVRARKASEHPIAWAIIAVTAGHRGERVTRAA